VITFWRHLTFIFDFESDPTPQCKAYQLATQQTLCISQTGVSHRSFTYHSIRLESWDLKWMAVRRLCSSGTQFNFFFIRLQCQSFWIRQNRRRRRHREASEGRSVAPRWPRRSAILQRSAGGVLSLSLRIWSIHLQRGRPGGRFHSRLGWSQDSRQNGSWIRTEMAEKPKTETGVSLRWLS